MGKGEGEEKEEGGYGARRFEKGIARRLLGLEASSTTTTFTSYLFSTSSSNMERLFDGGELRFAQRWRRLCRHFLSFPPFIPFWLRFLFPQRPGKLNIDE